ncbi:PTS sugar transporter subunit IIC [Schleiferilactobacillus perolens]|nr:PTS sugar transporter subunit IIC [Schleiferilactobacillus perolens]MCI1891196.1 PTS sugar transporter subunit IIC [Schleiferilactobacillus harbinensis]MCI1911866.1 PTS sugar transporter subunit IIC [Schleiferilactobacillus harbinensis]MCI2171637.1 PTS sugar transporter subunit IIC [Schleiferilactobacillus perolens]
MNGLIRWLEKYVVPVATKIGSIRWLVALRDAFIATMPATMAGSVALILNTFVRDIPNQMGWTGIPKAMEWLIGINGQVWAGTIAVIGLIFAGTLGYHLAKQYGVEPLSGLIVTLGSFLMALTQAATVTTALPRAITGAAAKTLTEAGAVLSTVKDPATGKMVHNMATTGWGFFNFNGHFGSQGLFTAMIVGGVAGAIFIFLMKKDLTIKMPDGVPPAVTQAFAAIIPATAAFYVVGIFTWAFTKLTSMAFVDWVAKAIQEPLLHASQGYGMVLLLTLLVQIFWFFGIHGTNVLGPILDAIWLTAQYQNINTAAANPGAKLPYLWTRTSFDLYAWMGGAGSTLILLICIFIFSKRPDERAVAKLAIAPGVFNINEPVMFGLPIVLNAIYFIPFVLAPAVMVSIAYFAVTHGLVAPIKNQVVWNIPPLFNSFLATADWRAPVLQLVNFAVGFLIWAPFVIASNRIKPDQVD